jgi:hypothetical protein
MQPDIVDHSAARIPSMRRPPRSADRTREIPFCPSPDGTSAAKKDELRPATARRVRKKSDKFRRETGTKDREKMRISKAAASIALAASLLTIEAPVEAATIKLVSGTAGLIPDAGQTNEVVTELGLGAPLAGFFGAKVILEGRASLLVEFLGYEAGYANSFSFAGGGFSSETDDPTPGDNSEIFAAPPSYRTDTLAGLLHFVFSTSGGGAPKSVANATNPNKSGKHGTGINFFASIVGDPGAHSGRSVILFFDDNGANGDSDYDDLVVRLSVVPVPPSLPLLLGALVGLHYVSRRRPIA